MAAALIFIPLVVLLGFALFGFRYATGLDQDTHPNKARAAQFYLVAAVFGVLSLLSRIAGLSTGGAFLSILSSGTVIIAAFSILVAGFALRRPANQ